MKFDGKLQKEQQHAGTFKQLQDLQKLQQQQLHVLSNKQDQLFQQARTVRPAHIFGGVVNFDTQISQYTLGNRQNP